MFPESSFSLLADSRPGRRPHPRTAPRGAGLLFLLAVALMALSVSKPSSLQGQAPPPAVTLRILDETSRNPLSLVEVVARGPDGVTRTFRSDAEGRLVLPAGTAAFTLHRAGYLPREIHPDSGDATILLTPSPFGLDQVTVTATRAEKRLEDAPGAVSVITAEALSRRNVGRLDHIVSSTPGVYNHRPNVLDDGHGSIQLRGLNGQKRTLVLLDGIPMNDGYNGGVRFGGFAAEELERVEVVRGPNSSLYGGYAMAGVVNFVSRMPEGRTLRADVGFGPDIGASNGMSNQRKLYLSAGERFGPVSAMASYRRFSTDGYVWDEVVRPGAAGAGTTAGSGWLEQLDRTGSPVYQVGTGGRRGIEEETFTGRMAWEVGPATTLSVTAMHVTHGHSHGTPHTLLRNADGTPIWSGSFTVDADSPRRFTLSQSNFLQSFGGKTHTFVAGRVETQWGRAAVRGGAGWNDYASWYSTYDASATPEGGSGRIVRSPAPSVVADLQSTLPLGNAHLLTVGATLKRDGAELAETNLSDWTDTLSTTGLRYEASGEVLTMAVFAQDEIRLSDRVTTYLGLRLDRWETRDGYADDVGKPGYPQAYENRTTSFLSPRVALVLRPTDASRVKFSASRAFRGPTVFELYRTWTLSSGAVYYANPDLGPETVTSFDLGVQHRFESLVVGATVFRNDVRDLINRMTLEGNDARFINTGRAASQGLELEAERRLGSAGRLTANYTWTDTEVIENETAPATEGKRLTGVPEHMANAGLEFDPGRWTVGVNGRYVGKRFSTDTNVDTHNGVFASADPHFLLDLKGSYRWRGMRASVSVDNALDRRYYDYNLAPGRTLLLELGAALR